MPFDAIAARKIEALMAGRALPTHTHARVSLQPHALAVAAVPLSGEDGTLHAIAFGWLREGPQVLSVADPRDVAAMNHLFEQLGERFERLAAYCLRRSTFPQIVVTSRSAVELLRNIADDHRFLDRSPGAARFARQLTYFTDRADVETQQAIVVTTELLCWHWATPLNRERERHLGTVLASIEPDADGLEASIERASLVPMGAATMPTFDNEELVPRLNRRHRLQRAMEAAERTGDLSTAERIRWTKEALEREIHAVLGEVVLAMDGAIRRGVCLFTGLAAPELPEVDAWAEEERRAFARFQHLLGEGRLPPRRDSARGAAYRLLEQETAMADVEAAVQLGDQFGRIRSVLSGRSIAGRIDDVRTRRLPGTRRTEHAFDVVTPQDGLTVRVRDEFRWAEDTRFQVVVTGYAAEAGGLRIHFCITRGMKRPGLPPEGMHLVLVRHAPDRRVVQRTRSARSDRLRPGLPWTHARGAAALRRPGRPPAPEDPLAEVLLLAGGDA